MFVNEIIKGEYPVIAFSKDDKGKISFDSVLVVGIAKTSSSNRVKLTFQGDRYIFLRAELLANERYSLAKTKPNKEEANELRRILREKYKVGGLEGEL